MQQYISGVQMQMLVDAGKALVDEEEPIIG